MRSNDWSWSDEANCDKVKQWLTWLIAKFIRFWFTSNNKHSEKLIKQVSKPLIYMHTSGIVCNEKINKGPFINWPFYILQVVCDIFLISLILLTECQSRSKRLPWSLPLSVGWLWTLLTLYFLLLFNSSRCSICRC